MKKITAILILSLFTISFSYSQTLPDWVLEMKKPNTNFQLLKTEFEDFWKDKMEVNKKENKRDFEQEQEFPFRKNTVG